MKNRMIPMCLLALACLMPLVSCGIRLKGAKKVGNTVIETFLVEGGAEQYFVKPLWFTGIKGKLLADFTFRSPKDSQFKAKINFTRSGAAGSKIDSFRVVAPGANEAACTVKKMDVRNVTGGTRYFSEVSNPVLHKLFINGTLFDIIVYSGGEAIKYTPAGKSLKKVGHIPKVLQEE